MNDPVPAIFKRHIGIWQGNYIKTDAKGNFLRDFKFTITMTINGINYQQQNHYEFRDGKTIILNFDGVFEDGILKLTSKNYDDFQAFAWDSGYDTIGFRVDKKQEGDLITYMETIYLVTDNHRVRTTQEFKNNQFVGVNLIEETKIKISE